MVPAHGLIWTEHEPPRRISILLSRLRPLARRSGGARRRRRRGRVGVVGAGYTGLSAAIELAKNGYRVVVVESKDVGFGASGRNGGQICTGFSKDITEIEKRVGRTAAEACWSIARDAKQLIADRVAEYQIDCDLKPGYLHVADRASQVDELKHALDDWAGYGANGLTFLNRQELRDRLESEAYFGALREEDAGHLHPLNYCLGLAEAARRLGVTIYENSHVTSMRTDGKPRVETANGSVSSEFLVLAGNAYLKDAAPALYRRLMPVASYILATEPLGENRARALIRDDEAVCDTNFVVNYYRLSADKRMLFGGRASYSTLHPKDLSGFMRPRMLQIFPQLDDVAVDYCWGGYIGLTADRMPHVGRLGDRTYFSQGYSGTGVAMSGMCGKILAETIAGQAERFDVSGGLQASDLSRRTVPRPSARVGDAVLPDPRFFLASARSSGCYSRCLLSCLCPAIDKRTWGDELTSPNREHD